MGETTANRQDRALAHGIDRGLGETSVPGVAAAVVDRGGLVEFAARGRLALDGGPAPTPETVFRVGSISKIITALAVMQQVERGRLALDDPLASHLRSASVTCAVPGAPEITIRHLLTHTSGIGELRRLGDVAVEPFVGLAMPPHEEVPDLAIYYRDGIRTTRAAGEAWTYANHAFGILGLLLQDVTGREFSEYAHEEILRPLGMGRAGFRLTPDLAARLAVGYGRKRGTWRSVPHWEIAPYPAGNLYASVADMAHLAAALLGRGGNAHGRVLGREAFGLMTTPQEDVDPRHPRMGLGLWLGSQAGLATCGHDGGWTGFLSSLLAAPDQCVAAIAFTNSDQEVPNGIAAETLRALAGLPTRAEELTAMPSLSAAEGEHLLGHYGAPARDVNLSARFRMDAAEYELRERDGTVEFRTFIGPTRRGAVLRDAGGGLYAYEGPHGEVTFVEPALGPDGRADSLRIGFERHPRGGGPSLRGKTALTAAAGVATALAAEALRRRAR